MVVQPSAKPRHPPAAEKAGRLIPSIRGSLLLAVTGGVLVLLVLALLLVWAFRPGGEQRRPDAGQMKERTAIAPPPAATHAITATATLAPPEGMPSPFPLPTQQPPSGTTPHWVPTISLP